MRGIAGWIGSLTEKDSPENALKAMASRYSTDIHSLQVLTGTPAAALNVGARTQLASDGNILLNLAGRPTRADLETPYSASEILQAIRSRGADALADIHGQFALAYTDAGSQTALFAVDRMGIEPLVLQAVDQACLYSSRADAITDHPAVTPVLNDQALFDFIYFHQVPSPETIFVDQIKLQPGQLAEFRNGALETRCYWQPNYQQKRQDFESLKSALFDLEEAAVRRAAATSEQTGTFLSGGTDSSSVTGLLAKTRGEQDTQTFSIGFAAEGYDEMEFARLTAQHFGTQPNEYYVTPDDVLAAIPRVAAAYDEPFGNASAIPTYFCARLAAEKGMAALLAGDGGDEIFAGNARYVKQKIFGFYQRIPGVIRKAILEPLLLHSPLGKLPILRKGRSYIEQALIPLPDQLETYNLLHRQPLEEIFTRDFLARVDTGNPAHLLRDSFQRAKASEDLNRILEMERKFVLADNDLRKVSRMCELAGIEVRYPMLDEHMVEFAATIPCSLKIRGLKLRYFFKRAMRGFLPNDILTKRKQGFGLPFGVWMRDHPGLHEFAEERLQRLSQRGIINPEYIDILLKRHREEHAAYYGVMIWVFMMLEEWLATHGFSQERQTEQS